MGGCEGVGNEDGRVHIHLANTTIEKDLEVTITYKGHDYFFRVLVIRTPNLETADPNDTKDYLIGQETSPYAGEQRKESPDKGTGYFVMAEKGTTQQEIKFIVEGTGEAMSGCDVDLKEPLGHAE